MSISEKKDTTTLTVRDLPPNIYHGLVKLKGSFGVRRWEDLLGVIVNYEFDDEEVKKAKDAYQNDGNVQ